MNDLLDELRHVNPIDPDTLTIDRALAATPARRHHTRRLAIAAVGATAIVAAIALLPGRAAKDSETLAARAYAAVTKPGVRHWRTALRVHFAHQGTTQSIVEGWAYNGVTHVLMWELYDHKPRLEIDRRIANGRATTWLAYNGRTQHTKAPPVGSDPGRIDDPVAIFRRAYKQGKLSSLGANRMRIDLPGRSDDRGDYTAYYDIDPRTSLPLRYVITSPGGPTTTLQFRLYETLPVNAATRARLRLLDHPAPPALQTSAIEHFAVLRNGTPPRGRLAAAVKTIARAEHLDLHVARQLAPGYALAPTKDGVCMIIATAHGAGAGCADLAQALERGIGMGVPNPARTPNSANAPRPGVALAVPDGIPAIKTRFHGKWTRRPVHHNFVRIPRFSGQYTFVTR